MDIIEALENRIKQLHNWEWEAKEARDYPACLRLYGAIIYLTQFLEELKMTGIKAAMAMAKQKLLVREKERIINIFAVNPTMKCKAVTKVTKLILLNGPYLLNGRHFEVKAKSLGAGVYELWSELME